MIYLLPVPESLLPVTALCLAPFFKATPMEMAHQNEKLKAVATLASGLAHEIKNPLTTLKTFSEYVPLKKDDPEFIRQYQRIVPAEIDRINDLISDLLAFAKPSTPQMQAVNPSEIIQSLLIMLEQKLKSSRVTINTELENNALLQADPNQLKQVLLNLILNAVDAMPEGGTLTIQTAVILSLKGKESKGALRSFANAQDDNMYTITIADTGCGIDPKDLPHIFDPFFTKKEKGTGLGLSITQGIIEKHGGKIIVESKLGQGTTFKIQLPVK